MSHNVRLSGIKFKSLSLLKAAVEELKAEGANVTLVEGDACAIRGWAGRKTKVDMVLQVHDSNYDVGFERNEQGEYVPMLESAFRHPILSSGHGAKPVEGCTVDYSGVQIGRLSQRYALLQAEVSAAQSGYSTTRAKGPGGQFQLQVTVGG